ncbi:hypothetical protein ACIBL6_16905 [Streptomyces sp. NPDC050400]|uniref:hypothetical protein n=1 Tax=Streptomyces sp. NPDC050400 TaxID=3365610 RepID=UPI0037A8C257
MRITIRGREVVEHEGRRVEREYVAQFTVPRFSTHEINSSVADTKEPQKSSLLKRWWRRTNRTWKTVAIVSPIPGIDSLVHGIFWPADPTWIQQAAAAFSHLISIF